MTERTLRLVLAVVAVLAGLYLVTAVYRGIGEGSGDAGDLPASFTSLTALEADAVESVTIVPQNGADTLRIRQSGGDGATAGDGGDGVTGGGWSVNGLPADSARVERLLADVLDAGHAGVIARNPANHAGLGVSRDSAVIVRLEAGGAEPRELLVGDAGPAYPSVYVRIDGEDAVHVFQSDLSTSARQTLDQWRNRVVVQVDTARIQRLEVAGALDGDGEDGPGSAYVVERADDGWSLVRTAGEDGAGGDGTGSTAAAVPADPTATPADPAAMRRALGGLRRLMAQGFAAERDGAVGVGGDQEATDPGAPADAPARSLVALDVGGDTLAALSIGGGEGDDASFLVRARGDSIVYRVSRFDVSRILPDIATLVPEATEAGDPDL